MKSLLKNWNKLLYYIFSGLFIASFSLILLNVVFNKTIFMYNTFFLLLYMAVFAAAIIFATVFLKKKASFFEKRYNVIVVISCVFLFCMQILSSILLEFNPSWDMEAIYQGAISWVEQGDFTTYFSDTCHQDYFYIFPNNLGSMAFLALFFKLASLLGIKSYFMVASVLNAVMIVMTLVFVQAICKRFYGVTGGIVSVMLFLCSLPFYFMAPVFYTDSLSMVFLVGAFYGLLKAQDSVKLKQKSGWYIFCALMCWLGAMIKMTVLVFAIAALVYFVLKKNWRELLAYLMVTVTVVGLGFSLFNSYIYSEHLDRDKAEQTNMPAYYWIDLAVHGRGYYNNDIYWDAINEQDPSLRSEKLIKDIKAEIKERGFKGMYNLFESKSALAFGDGTYALSDFLDDRPVKEDTFLHKFLLYEGEYYERYSTVATAIFLVIQIMMLFSVCLRRTDFKLLIPQLCVFGLMTFLMFWEINSRYITTVIPCIIICAAGGLCALSERIINRRINIK